MYFIEHGLPPPDRLTQAACEDPTNVNKAVGEMAEALAFGDDARLAAAIDSAEARHLIPHAARMRIVLAQRTGDRAQLEQARSVIEQLGDRQFLRRLEEVRAALG